ncbi:hypothetical protein BKA66DRAFT_581428 [Pyrenochaeta sp. MPI-SDFR-AT-0127]|nr:hypothetical protein BKA66DRAFT_581428 [Pyrenochaeta sp. MPI-SDFR-AT-0127]
MDQTSESSSHVDYTPYEHTWNGTCSSVSVDETSDDSDYEPTLDLKGRKHMTSYDDAEGLYTLQPDVESSHLIFPIPGKESADTLRRFIRDHLHSYYITDEYGYPRPLDSIPHNHLPNLQAKLWRELPQHHASILSSDADLDELSRGFGPFIRNPTAARISAAIGNNGVSDDDELLACHIKIISTLLDSEHIFVLRDSSQICCQGIICQKEKGKHTTHAHIVVLEPLLDWGSVTPTNDVLIARGKVLVFRRNGEKMQDPHWTQISKRLIPQKPLAFCVECLERLMNSRVKAWKILDRCKNSNSEITLPIERPETGQAGRSGSQLAVPDESSAEPTLSSLKFDGASFCRLPLQQQAPENLSTSARHRRIGANFAVVKIWSDQKTDCHKEEITENIMPNLSLPGTRPFTQTLRRMSVGSAASSLATKVSALDTVNRLISLPGKASTNQSPSHPPVQAHHIEQYPRLGSKALSPSEPDFSTTSSSVTPERKTNHTFGVEIDKNAIVTYIRMATAKRDIMAKEKRSDPDIRRLFAPTWQLPKLQPRAQAPREDADAAKVDLKANPSSSRLTLSSEFEQSQDSQALYESNARAQQFKSWKKKLPPSLKSGPTMTKSVCKVENPHQPFSPNLAKRSPFKPEDIYDTVSNETYEAYETYVPSPKDLICSCKQPARTYAVRIAQCANRDCVVRWYHHACLDKSEKLKSYHGTMICQQCRVDKQFNDEDEKHGWTLERIVEAETKMAFTGKEMVDALPGLAGCLGTPNPYGLGIVIEEPVVSIVMPTEWNQGALGSLSALGYTASQPYMVTEAYTNAQAYVNYAEDYEDYEEEYEEEYEEYTDESATIVGEDTEPDRVSV